MTVLTGVLVAIFSVGGAATIAALFKGFSGWRDGSARTEARAISNLEKYRDEADHRAAIERHKVNFYQDELTPYLQNRIGDLEYLIRTTWGAEHVPPPLPRPVMSPVPRLELTDRRSKDDG